MPGRAPGPNYHTPRHTRLRQKQHRRYAENRAVVTLAKSRPCLDCHVQYPPHVMQFDHRDPSTKKFVIGASLFARPLSAVLEEIEKCDVVCANCHFQRTWERTHRGR